MDISCQIENCNAPFLGYYGTSGNCIICTKQVQQIPDSTTPKIRICGTISVKRVNYGLPTTHVTYVASTF